MTRGVSAHSGQTPVGSRRQTEALHLRTVEGRRGSIRAIPSGVMSSVKQLAQGAWGRRGEGRGGAGRGARHRSVRQRRHRRTGPHEPHELISEHELQNIPPHRLHNDIVLVTYYATLSFETIFIVCRRCRWH